MILEFMFIPIFNLISLVISLIPSAEYTNGGFTNGFYSFINIGLYFFGSAPFLLVITNVLLWTGIELAWSIIEWIYKKIPGIS